MGETYQERPEAGEHTEEGAFAGSIGPHDHDRVALRHVEAQLTHQPPPIWCIQGHSVRRCDGRERVYNAWTVKAFSVK